MRFRISIDPIALMVIAIALCVAATCGCGRPPPPPEPQAPMRCYPKVGTTAEDVIAVCGEPCVRGHVEEVKGYYAWQYCHAGCPADPNAGCPRGRSHVVLLGRDDDKVVHPFTLILE